MASARTYALLALAVFVGSCGGGAVSLEARCRSWCARRNADTDCLNQINCDVSCGGIAYNATNTGCASFLDALFDCFDASADICAPGGAQACGAENTALVSCENTAVSDVGTDH